MSKAPASGAGNCVSREKDFRAPANHANERGAEQEGREELNHFPTFPIFLFNSGLLAAARSAGLADLRQYLTGKFINGPAPLRFSTVRFALR